MALLDITGVAGASPSWTLTVLDSAGVSIGDYVTAPITGLPVGDYGVYRVSDVPDAFTIDVEDDVSPDAPYGEPSAGSGAAYSPTTIYKLSQVPDGGPGWGEAVRRDLKVLDGVITDYLKSELATEEDFTLTVDYATGSSPAAGTRITNQAEATALGTLKHVMDVFDVLPPFVDHVVTVDVAAGTQYARPGDLSAIDLRYIQHSPTALTVDFSYPSALGYAPGVLFSGAVTDFEAGVAGTIGANTFTRTAGTWTPDELIGKFVEVTAGAGAGAVKVIRANTATELTFVGTNFSSGAATIRVYDPATVFVQDDNDGGSASYLVYNSADPVGEATFGFRNCSFGDGVSDISWVLVGHNFSPEACVFNLRGSFAQISVNAGSQTTLSQCYVNLDTGRSVYAASGAECLLKECLFTGGTAGNPMFWVNGRAATGQVLDCHFKPDPGFTNAVLELNKGYINFAYIDRTTIEGNGSCAGVRFALDGVSVGLRRPDRLQINDCAVAVDVESAEVYLDRAFATSTGNTVGWKISNASSLVVEDPANIGATTEIQVDGQDAAYTDLANSGDEIIGPAGSSIKRR